MVLLTAFGAFLGATLSLLVAASLEYFKKPRLQIDDGAPLFPKAMPVRWSGSSEPFTAHVLPDSTVAHLFDPVKYDVACRRDCFPGSEEIADVAAKFDDDDECYGWSNETYLQGKGC